ncbi:MAG: RIP metalloprotease RseP [Candidatus Omnitrophota bacterium]|nr:RIP metalloprotease RseP [Candidatus Omnitrophota bacterium]MBU1929609.1 RIP metalloprotease RseP [Candidatus Omnitrophota bacterium]MBU2034802.1 RIP metalloprotease RseP [Candidatus Omnitrophota bacterium]MBU2222280.1 RIP metalloprotease RseP [Candidatus Omnitrophota bacterium]MBU2258544.1 RIP metalloprotease RseP [Candidatus Omnitrophota bacterium]
MISFFIFIFILGLLIIVHEWGHFIASRRVGVRVEKFSIGFGPRLFTKVRNKTEYSLSAIPFGGYVKLAGDNLDEYKGGADEYFSKPLKQRFKIIFAGAFLNYIMGFLCFWLIFFIGFPTLTTKVGGLVDGFGAKESGIISGDKIISIDNKKTLTWPELQAAVQMRKDKSKVDVMVLREGQELNFAVVIREKPLKDVLGEKRNIGLLGITPADEIVQIKYGFFKSFFMGMNKALDLSALTYKALWRMITGNLSIKDSVTGPLGMYYLTSKAASIGLVAILHLMAALSISLAIFNLLPLPALDGGHIVLLLIEKIRGKALSLRAERIFSNVGMSLLITLAVAVFYNDLIRFGWIDKVNKLFIR